MKCYKSKMLLVWFFFKYKTRYIFLKKIINHWEAAAQRVQIGLSALSDIQKKVCHGWWDESVAWGTVKIRAKISNSVHRACRLKKKAQHEANKIKLDGLEKEHSKLNLFLKTRIILKTNPIQMCFLFLFF